MSAKKNILFIMADQLRYDYLGCNGHPNIKTPNIDALAKRGVILRIRFASQLSADHPECLFILGAICSPMVEPGIIYLFV